MTDFKEAKKLVNECGLNIKEPLHSVVLKVINEALDKQVPKKVTHEASMYKCCTCPNCKNVVDEFEKWGESTVRVTSRYCRYCGQRLDWGGQKDENNN